MELATKYDPSSVESKWYQYWLDNRLFASKPDGREPYTIVIPPPNVTGVLHMGHMLNNTIQDILIRRARMTGKNRPCLHRYGGQGCSASGRKRNTQIGPHAGGVFKTCLAMDGRARRDYPAAAPQTRRLVRLGAYGIHHG